VVSGSGGVQPIRPALHGGSAVVAALYAGRRNKANEAGRGCLSGNADGRVAIRCCACRRGHCARFPGDAAGVVIETRQWLLLADKLGDEDAQVLLEEFF